MKVHGLDFDSRSKQRQQKHAVTTTLNPAHSQKSSFSRLSHETGSIKANLLHSMTAGGRMNKSTLGSQVGKNKESTHLKINYKRFQILEEDDIAQVEEIFKHFDFSNRGRVATADLPNILRLLEFNIGKIEEADLLYEIDKKNKGTFTMKELTSLLSNTGFEE